MATDSKEYALALAPGWLQGPQGTAWLTAFGQLKDDLVDEAKQAVKLRLPALAPVSALALLGADRLILRGPGETDDAYRSRLAAAFETWVLAGTSAGIVAALRAAGLSNTATVENFQWSPAPPDGDAANWSRFHVVISKPHPWTQRVWDDGWSYNEPNATFDSTATVDDVARVRLTIAQWKSTHARCVGIVVSFGSSTTITSFTATSFTFSDGARSIVWDGVS